MIALAPIDDAVVGGNWTRLPADPTASLASVVDEPFNTINDADFIQHAVAGGGTGADLILFDFPFPFNTSYGDGNVAVTGEVGAGGIVLRMRARGKFTATDIPMDFVVRRGASTVHTGAFTLATGVFIAGATGPWIDTTLTLLTDPITGTAWLAADLLTTSFGLSKTGAAGNTTQVSRYVVQMDLQMWRGEDKARLKPNMQEPAHYCAICSMPFHLHELIRISESRHPLVGRLVCKMDYDIIDPEPTSPRFVEGDFDYDLE